LLSALWVCCEKSDEREAVADAVYCTELLPLLLQISTNKEEAFELRYKAVQFFQNIAHDQTLLQHQPFTAICNQLYLHLGSGSIEQAVVFLLESTNLEAQHYAAATLAHLAGKYPNKTKTIAQLGSIEILLNICNHYYYSKTTSSDEHGALFEQCLLALVNLSVRPKNQIAISQKGLSLIMDIVKKGLKEGFKPKADSMGFSIDSQAIESHNRASRARHHELASQILLNIQQHPQSRTALYKEELKIKSGERFQEMTDHLKPGSLSKVSNQIHLGHAGRRDGTSCVNSGKYWAADMFSTGKLKASIDEANGHERKIRRWEPDVEAIHQLSEFKGVIENLDKDLAWPQMRCHDFRGNFLYTKLAKKDRTPVNLSLLGPDKAFVEYRTWEHSEGSTICHSTNIPCVHPEECCASKSAHEVQPRTPHPPSTSSSNRNKHIKSLQKNVRHYYWHKFLQQSPQQTLVKECCDIPSNIFAGNEPAWPPPPVPSGSGSDFPKDPESYGSPSSGFLSNSRLLDPMLPKDLLELSIVADPATLKCKVPGLTLEWERGERGAGPSKKKRRRRRPNGNRYRGSMDGGDNGTGQRGTGSGLDAYGGIGRGGDEDDDWDSDDTGSWDSGDDDGYGDGDGDGTLGAHPRNGTPDDGPRNGSRPNSRASGIPSRSSTPVDKFKRKEATTGQYSYFSNLQNLQQKKVGQGRPGKDGKPHYMCGDKLTLGTPTDGGTVYFTIDGSDPLPDGSNCLTGSIPLETAGNAIVVKAITVKDGMYSSEPYEINIDVEESFENWAEAHSVFAPRIKAGGKSLYNSEKMEEKILEMDMHRVLGKNNFVTFINREIAKCKNPKCTVDDVMQAMKDVNSIVCKVFDVYAAYDGGGFDIRLNAYMNFIDDIDILEEDSDTLTRQSFDMLFIVCNQPGNTASPDEAKANPKDAFMRYEFREMLVRAAMMKFLDTGKAKDPVESIQLLCKNHIEPRLQALNVFHDTNDFRKFILYDKEVDKTLKHNYPVITQVFELLKGQLEGRLSMKDFVDFIERMGMFENHPFLADFSRRHARLAFVWSRRRTADELKRSISTSIDKEDFMECLCRIAWLKYLPTDGELDDLEGEETGYTVDPGCNRVPAFFSRTPVSTTHIMNDDNIAFRESRPMSERLSKLMEIVSETIRFYKKSA